MKARSLKSVMIATAVACVAVGFSLSRLQAEDGPQPALQQVQPADTEAGLPEEVTASQGEVGPGEIGNVSHATRLFRSVDEAVAAIQDIPMSIDEQGEMKLAGVVGMWTDKAGRLIVELRWDGDLENDPVLILNVPVSEGPDGQLETYGLQGYTFGNETVTLTIETSGGGPGDFGPLYVDEDYTKCRHRTPIPEDPENPPGCSGTCPRETDQCKFKAIDVPKPEEFVLVSDVLALADLAMSSPIPDTGDTGMDTIIVKQELVCGCFPPDP